MAWTDAESILAEVGQSTDIGRVQLGARHVRDATRFRDLFGLDTSEPPDRAALEGCVIERTAITEEPLTGDRNLATETWTIRVIHGLTGRAGDEKRFNTRLDALWERFRGLKTVGSLQQLSAASTDTIEPVQFAGRTVYLGEVELEATDLVTITTPGPARPKVETAIAATREDYSDTSAQIASYLGDLDGIGRVYPERQWVTNREQAIDMLSIESAGAADSKRLIRQWQTFRRADEEQHGVGLRTLGLTRWALEGWHGWQDSHNTYGTFQAQIDTVRTRIRGLQTLGNRFNPTNTLSGPLQVTEIGGRMRADFLCHYADCEIGIEEVVYA